MGEASIHIPVAHRGSRSAQVVAPVPVGCSVGRHPKSKASTSASHPFGEGASIGADFSRRFGIAAPTDVDEP